MRSKKTAGKAGRTALAVAVVLMLGACGQALADSPDSNPPTTVTIPDGGVTTTTVVVTSTTSAPNTTTPPMPLPDTVDVMVYVLGGPDADINGYDCADVTPVTRQVETPKLLTGAIEALLAGPTDAERSAGYDSWFSTEVGWTVDSVTISDGVARIDFGEDSQRIPNASTSCGSMGLRAQLDSTATQFPTVDRVVYSIGGDIAAFYHWLESDVPEV